MKRRNIKHKKHKKFWFVLSGLIILLGLTILSNHIFNRNYNNLSKTDRTMLSQLNMLYSETELKEKKLWKQYDLRELPIVLVRKWDCLNFSGDTINLLRGNAYAIGVKGLENKWYAQKIDMPASYHLPDVYRLSVLTPGIGATWSPFGNFQTIGSNMKLGESSHVYYMKYNKKNLEHALKPSQYFVPFLSHELFHYTIQNDWGTEKEIILSGKSKEWFSYLGLQYASLDVLLGQLNSYDYKELKRAVADYVTISEYRKLLDPIDYVEEKKHETVEGTATYVGIKASSCTDTPKLKLLSGIKSDKDRKFSVLFSAIAENSGYTSEIKWNRYDSGALLCMTLDRLYHSHVWQDSLNAQSVKKPVTLYDLIKDYYNTKNLEKYARSIEEIKKEYHFEKIEEQAEKIEKQVN